MTNYIPERQDIIWLDFDPSAGSEIEKRRPAVVISHSGYSKLTNLTLVCPITNAQNNRFKRDNYLIPVNDIGDITGFVNPLQVRTYDFKVRMAIKAAEMDDATFFKVLTFVRQIVD